MQAHTSDDSNANRQSDSLAALAITLFLVVASLYVIQQLRADSDLQDCVLSGKAACDS